MSRSGHANLNLAAESPAMRTAWLSAQAEGTRDSPARYMHRRQRVQERNATVQAQMDAAAARVQLLNARYEQAGRGAQVKWFFQRPPLQSGAAPSACCQLLLRCRAAVGDSAPPAYPDTAEQAPVVPSSAVVEE